MNIVQVPRRFVRQEWGGTETVVLETSKRLGSLGHENRILCPNALADNDAETIDGVPVRRVPYFYPYLGLRPGARERMDKKGGNLFSFALMRELSRLPDLDLIHLHTLKRVGGIARYVARKRNIPYIVSLHGGLIDVPDSEGEMIMEPARGALEWGRLLGLWVGSNRVLDDAAAILCVGENEREAVQARYPNQQVVCVPNGVDAPRFARGDRVGFRARHGLPAEAFVLLTVARIDPQKNQMLAVRALPALLREEPNAHLLLVGPVTDNAYREALLAEAARLGIARRVTVLPGLQGQELVDAYHAADLFVLASRHEPFGIVILEAWAAGLPVVAAAVGGIPYFVRNGQDAMLFHPDDGDDLLTAVHRLRQSPAQRAYLALEGQRRAIGEFDWLQITRRLSGLYESVVSEHAKRGLTGTYMDAEAATL